MYILNPEKTKKALSKAGYASLSQLVKEIGCHRNTIHYFLNGANVFPDSLERMFALLKVEPCDLIESSKKTYSQKIILHIIDALNRKAPECCFVLFGSRAIGKEKRFSDFDVGIYRETKIPFSEYSHLKNIVDTGAEDLPVSVDLVNLTSADAAFLEDVKKGFVFLGGSPTSFEKLEERMYGSKT